MTPKYSPICDDPKKYPQNLHTPKNINFSEPPPPPPPPPPKKKNKLKYKILNPKNCPEPAYVWKFQSTPPGGLGAYPDWV